MCERMPSNGTTCYSRTLSTLHKVSQCDSYDATLHSVILQSTFTFLTHGCCVAVFVTLCDHSHIPKDVCALCWNRKICMSSSAKATQIPVHFVCIYASFYHRFQSFQSLFRSLFLLVSVAVSIYSNRLQNTGAKLFCIWNFLSAAFLASTSRPQGPLETVICSRYRCFRTKHKMPSDWLTSGAWSYGWSG